MKKLTVLDNLFLQLEMPTAPMHVGAVLVFDPPAGSREQLLARVEAKMRAACRCADPFGQKLVKRRGPLARPRWQVLEQVDTEFHVHRATVPAPGDDAALCDLISRLHTGTLDMSRPLWECTLLDGLADGRVAIYYKIHHACIDGVAGMKRIQRALSKSAHDDTPALWTEKRARIRQREVTGVRARLTNSLTNALSGVRGQVQSVPELLRALDWMRKQSAAGASRATPAPFSAPPTPVNLPITAARSFATQRLSLAEVKRVGKHFGATVNDMAIAVVSGALRKYLLAKHTLPEQPLVAMVPISIRDQNSETAGNQVGNVICNMATHIEGPRERLELIKLSAREGIDLLRGMSRQGGQTFSILVALPAIIAQLLHVAHRIPLPFNVVISNVAGPREPLYQNGMRLNAIYPVSALFEKQGVNVTILSYLDSLDFGLIGCRDTVLDIDVLAGYLREAFDELQAIADDTVGAAVG